MRNLEFALVLVIAVFFGSTAHSAEATNSIAKRVTVEQFDTMRANTNYVLLDVRSKAEFEKGHIPGATNFDISSPHFADSVGALDKSKTYLVNCAVGMRSARACKKMQELGFTNLFDLAPGFDGWKKAGKPIEK
jgi:rhodanese-related sulfurtransferase